MTLPPTKLAKYPFLKEAASYVRARSVDLDALLRDLAFERPRALGIQRTMEALEDGIIDDHPLASDVDAEIDLLSYPIARMLVSSVNDPYLLRRYAVAEAKRAHRHLQQEELPFVLAVASELGLQATSVDGEVALHFTDYLRFTAVMRSKDWKLVNQEVRSGQVHVTKYRFIRLVQQLLHDKILSELPLEVTEEILSVFSDDLALIRKRLEGLRKEAKGKELGRVSLLRFPPCMKQILTNLQAAENVPHTARFALTSFLHTIGMNAEEIMALFGTAPDFDEGRTRYQVLHVTGISSGKEYTPPECSTMKSYGICYNPDALCAKIRHPLSYYRAKGRPWPPPKPAAAAPSAPAKAQGSAR